MKKTAIKYIEYQKSVNLERCWHSQAVVASLKANPALVALSPQKTLEQTTRQID